MASIAAALIPSLISTGVGMAGQALGNSGGAFGSPATKAANAQVNAFGQAIGSLQGNNTTLTKNASPYTDLGSTSAGSLMNDLQSGTFGPGSLGPVPTFTAPTLADAENTPGYQFTQQQGNKGILQGAAAAGGNINGGTFKSLGTFDTNLANTTYGDVYNRALQGYQAQLQGFGTNMAAQNQGFNQLFAPTQLGASSTQGLNQQLLGSNTSIAQLMALIGQAQAGGITGTAQTGGPLNGLLNTGGNLLNNYAVLNGPGSIKPGDLTSGAPGVSTLGGVGLPG